MADFGRVGPEKERRWRHEVALDDGEVEAEVMAASPPGPGCLAARLAEDGEGVQLRIAKDVGHPAGDSLCLAQVAFEIGDAENESGEIETENALEIEGNNNNACLGQLQFGNTGNFTNQQGALQYASDADDLEFGAGELEFAPENETACEQAVQQSAAASSTF